MSTTYISKINLGQSKVGVATGAGRRRVTDTSRGKVIEVAVPSTTAHALTIIAGKNRTGKSHLLRHTERAVRAHNQKLSESAVSDPTMGAAAANVVVHALDPSLHFGTLALINDVSLLLDRFISFPLFAREKDFPSKLEALLENAKAKFIATQFECAEALLEAFQGQFNRHLTDEENHWETDKDMKALDLLGKLPLTGEQGLSQTSLVAGRERAGLARKLDEKKIYRANSEMCPALREFEALTGSSVYLRSNSKSKGMELVLRHGPNEIFSFGGRQGGWSQGYKVMISLFILIVYGRPQILLIDELENHLHPEFISKVCAFIKRYVPQTIVVTHHPHLIFSAFTDSAWYIELETSLEPAPDVDEFPSDVTVEKRAAPRRRIVRLSSDFERISATYALFDGRDKQLLDLASSCHEQLSIGLLQEIEQGLTLEVAESSQSAFQDTQTTQVAAVLQQMKSLASAQFRQMTMLDYGAGLGRVFFELQKTSSAHLLDIDWYFYEPSHEMCKRLKNLLDTNDLPIRKDKVLGALSSLGGGSIDVALLANVLHECTISGIVETFKQLSYLLVDGGNLLIAELTPLLSPERFGFSYAAEEIRQIANAFGYAASTSAIPIRSGLVTAHLTICQKRLTPDFEEGTKLLSELWKRKRRDLLQQYSAEISLSSTRNAIKVASILHAIASIDAHTEGFW